MSQSTIFGPVFVMFVLTFVVWMYLYARRIPFIRSQQLDDSQLAPLELARISPPAVSNPSDNLKNLFELPVVFYALSIMLFVTSAVDGLYVALAWAFTTLRIAHSLVHCTVNVIMLRFVLYAAASLALWLMLGRAAWQFFTA